ncbi:PTS sugar transporter subunit IIA [Enterococcus sp. AZ072]|uniref:PTS sugar transporter subunit IIA n=1 Tax=unclassified Enterococcus TaxID=2608891 RepID=UPI003D2CD97F
MADFWDEMYLDEHLVDLEINEVDNFSSLAALANRLEKNQCVNGEFSRAIQDREKEFSTGLPLENVGVAIPHTDSEYVFKQSMAIGILKNPVMFEMMGSPEVLVPVKIIFMLAIKEPKKQLEFLQALIEMFQKDEKVLAIVQAKTATEAVKKMKQNLK